MTLNHAAFVRQPDGITLVSDGNKTVTFDTPAMFAAACPAFVMPAGVVGINYELRGASLLHSRQLVNGSVTFSTDQDEALEAIILTVDDLEAARAEMAHPLWGITDLAEAKALAAKLIDADAEKERLKYVTPGSAQAMVYQAKLDEADRWDAAGNPPDLTGFPFIAGEVPLTAANAAALVGIWRGMQALWLPLAAQIEVARLGAKNAVTASGNVAAVKAAYDGVSWPA